MTYMPVPMAFVTQWKEHVADPATFARPVLTLGGFFCVHDLLNIDPSFNPDLASDKVLLLESDVWERLAEA
jgi:hypothetical protein